MRKSSTHHSVRAAFTAFAVLVACLFLLTHTPAAAAGKQGIWYITVDEDSEFCVAGAPIAAGGIFMLMAFDGDITFAVGDAPELLVGDSGVFETDLESFSFKPSYEDGVLYLDGWMSTESAATLRLAKRLALSIDGNQIVNLALEGAGLGEAMDAVLECSRGRSGWWGDGLILGGDEPAKSTPMQAVSGGTAFFVTSTGLAVTNHHVIANCRLVHSPRWGGVTILASDERADLALLRTERSGSQALALRARGPRLGEAAFIAGFPLTQLLGTGVKVTNGLVSGLSGLEGDRSMFQLTAPVQPGNSGGPVTDKDGALIGVVAGKLDDEETLRAAGSLPQNVNFAISGPVLQSFLDENGVAYSASGNARSVADLPSVTFRLECLG